MKYPKFTLLGLTYVLAIIILYGNIFLPFRILSLGYVGIFIAGILYSYGFTSGPAVVLLLLLAKEKNILLAGFLGALGALIADLTIFRFIKISFKDEISLLQKRFFKINKTDFLKKYFILLIASFIIISPLPDEIGVTLLASLTKISTKVFLIISYLLNTLGIFIILILGNII